MGIDEVHGVPDRQPLAGWAIVQSNGLTLIGRVKVPAFRDREPTFREAAILSPVFEFKPMLTDQGVIPLVTPVWLLGIKEFAVPQGAIVESVESFTLDQRAMLESFVHKAEAAQAQARSEGPARISVAPAGSEDVVADLLAKSRRRL